MRIALTHAFSWPEVRRGAERFVPELSAALVRRGHDVTHFSAAWRPGEAVERGVRTVRLRRRFEGDHRHEGHFGARLLPALLRNEFDVVHSLGRYDALASIAAARLRRDGRRTVITDLGLPDRSYWRDQGLVHSGAVSAVVRGIDIYSVMSRTAVESLAGDYGRTDGVVVPGGVALDSFCPSERREPQPTILFSGAMAERRKGVPVLLQALPLIAASEPEVQLWLSGPGEVDTLIDEAPADARRRVRHLGVGEHHRQHERYGRAWITCLPSTHDSFGMALVESLACGTPIVTTTHGAPQELVTEGVTGELCAPHDRLSLADACLRAFELARNPATVAACREAARPFDWDVGIAPLCEQLYAGGR